MFPICPVVRFFDFYYNNNDVSNIFPVQFHMSRMDLKMVRTRLTDIPCVCVDLITENHKTKSFCNGYYSLLAYKK